MPDPDRRHLARRPARPEDPRSGTGRPRRRTDAVTLVSWYLLLLMAIPSSLVVGSLGSAGSPATIAAAGLCLAYLAARWHPALGLDGERQPIRAAAVLLCCSVLASYVAANRVAMSTHQVNGADRGLILLAGWLGVMLLTADGIDRASRLDVLLRRIVIGATAMAAVGLIEFVTGTNIASYVTIPGLVQHHGVTDLMTRDGLVRVVATAAQPLEFSTVLAMSLPLAIHQARYADRQIRLRRWLQVTLIAAAIPMAVSRSAIVSLLLIPVLLVPTWPRRQRRLSYLVLAAVPLAAWIAVPSVGSAILTSFAHLGNGSSSHSRASAIAMAAPLIVRHPLFGQGFGTFNPQISFFVDDQFVTSLIETGLLGLLAVLAIFAAGAYATRSARSAATSQRVRDQAHALTTSLLVAVIAFATFDVLSFSIASGLFFVLLGCSGALWRLTRPAAAPPVPPIADGTPAPAQLPR